MGTETLRRQTLPQPEFQSEQAPSAAEVKSAGEGQAKVLGRRERNKAAKLSRIAAAARQHFATKGYDGTTLRGIAEEADVALGTVGFYAENKQDLVLLIFNEVMGDLVLRAWNATRRDAQLIDALIDFLRPIYSEFAAEVPLYRILLRENVFHGTSRHAVEFERHRGLLVGGLSELISRAGASGEVSSALDAELAGRTVFFIFFAGVRWWIAGPDPDVEHGLAELRKSFAMLVNGFKADGAVGGQLQKTPGRAVASTR